MRAWTRSTIASCAAVASSAAASAIPQLEHEADQQREWVRKALGSPDFSVLEGPPGSGKTTAIFGGSSAILA